MRVNRRLHAAAGAADGIGGRRQRLGEHAQTVSLPIILDHELGSTGRHSGQASRFAEAAVK
ncbi:MAG: hypothetical protein QOK02_6772 [Mycobacterium sp.]|nr:hypothetical protein [Mycobacterium sp.]